MNPLFLFMRWLQTVPLALLAFAPFRDEELVCDRRWGYLAAVSYMLLGGVVMALLSPLSSLGGQRNIIARDVTLAAVMAVFLIGWSRAVRTVRIRKLLVGMILLHYDLALQAISDVFAALILRERYQAEISAEAGSLTLDLCLLEAILISWPLAWFFLRHILRKNLPALAGREAARGLGYLCVVALLFTAATYDPRFELIPEVPLFVAALILTDVIAYYIFFQEIGVVLRQAETSRQLAAYQLQYHTIVSRMEGVRRLRHDLRHHLNVIGALNAQGKTEELTAYLQEYGKVYEQLERHQYCGDPTVDSVLGYYLAQAGEENISMACQARLQGPSRIEHMDMTVLLGNCLENALEAVRRLPARERRIALELQPMGETLLLRVVNACEQRENTDGFADWQSFPSGKSPGRMGVGLRSVSESAEKYGGSARFRRKDGEFTAEVTLCTLPAGQEELR